MFYLVHYVTYVAECTCHAKYTLCICGNSASCIHKTELAKRRYAIMKGINAIITIRFLYNCASISAQQ